MKSRIAITNPSLSLIYYPCLCRVTAPKWATPALSPVSGVPLESILQVIGACSMYKDRERYNYRQVMKLSIYMEH